MRRRSQALEAFQRAPLPTGGEDAWKYSRIAKIGLERFHPVVGPAPAAAVLPAMVQRFLDGFPDRAGLVVTSDGFPVSVEIAESAASSGVRLGAASLEPDAEALLGSVVGAVPVSAVDGFGALADAFALTPSC